MLLTGVQYEISFDESHIRIRRPTPDGPMTLLERPLWEVFTVEGGMFATDPDADEPDACEVAISFVDPSIEWEGAPLRWTPVFVVCALDRAQEVGAVVDDLNLAVQRIRRHRLGLPDLTPPPAVPDGDTWIRPDVVDAAGRVVGGIRQLRRLDLIHRAVRPDEFVLELAPTDQYFVVVTTLRVCLVDYDGLQVHEIPVDSIMSCHTETARPRQSQVVVDLGRYTSALRPVGTSDGARLSTALQFAIDARLWDNSFRAPEPDPVAMSHQWESLLEQHQLGTVSDDDLARLAAGVLQTTW